jgi:hypothetical protein
MWWIALPARILVRLSTETVLSDDKFDAFHTVLPNRGATCT